MKRFAAFLLAIPVVCSGQQNLFNHLYWKATGTHQGQLFGASGLDYIGKVNDNIGRSLAIGSDGGASFVYNRFPLDTASHFKFPGTIVKRGNLNGDAYPDYVCINLAPANRNGDRTMTVLLGTAQPDSFVTAWKIISYDVTVIESHLIVADCDSDGYDDIVIAETTPNKKTGRFVYYRGGNTVDSIPSQILDGDTFNHVGYALAVGHVRDTAQLALLEARPLSSTGDTVKIFSYPFGKNFSLHSTDTIFCVMHKGSGGYSTFNVFDMDEDGISDLVFGDGPGESVYRGGVTISPNPVFTFHQQSTSDGNMFDIGNVTGKSYHSYLVTSPNINAGGVANGRIWLFNGGKALKDSTIATAVGPEGFEDAFGTHVIALSDVSGDGIDDFMVGSDADLNHEGTVFTFLGSASYASPVSVVQKNMLPAGFTLEQNYPNPFTKTTDITFAIRDHRLYGKEVTLKIFDAAGRERLTAYRGLVDNYGYTIRVAATGLLSGIYWYRLSCGGTIATKMLTIIR